MVDTHSPFIMLKGHFFYILSSRVEYPILVVTTRFFINSGRLDILLIPTVWTRGHHNKTSSYVIYRKSMKSGLRNREENILDREVFSIKEIGCNWTKDEKLQHLTEYYAKGAIMKCCLLKFFFLSIRLNSRPWIDYIRCLIPEFSVHMNGVTTAYNLAIWAD